MRTGVDETCRCRGRGCTSCSIGVLAAIVVIGALLPWLAIADAWQTVGRDDFIADSGIGGMPRIAIAVQSLPFLAPGR